MKWGESFEPVTPKLHILDEYQLDIYLNLDYVVKYSQK